MQGTWGRKASGKWGILCGRGLYAGIRKGLPVIGVILDFLLSFKAAGKDGKYSAVPDLVCSDLLQAVQKILDRGE